MYQIDNSSAAAVIPASTSIGTPGFFTDGNPATGIAPTILPAEFMNMVMMELLGVLSAAGVTPSKSNFTQLVTAIKAVNKQTTILADTGTAGAYSAVNVPALTALPATGFFQRVNIAHANPGASTYSPDGLTPKPIYGLGLQSLQGGELPVGVAVLMYLVQAGVNGGSGAWIIIESLGGASQVAPATQSQHAVNAGQIQGQALTAFNAAGVAPAFTLTPVPAIAAYAAGQRFRVKFNAAGTGADTLSVSGIGAKNLKQYDSTGSKVAAVIASGQLADVEYDGTDLVILAPLPVARFGTPAEQLAGLLTTVMSNPAGVLALINSMFPTKTFSAKDFIRIPDVPGGFIIQWGLISNAASAAKTETYATPFPTQRGAVLLTGLQPTGNSQAYATLNSSGLSNFSWSGFAAAGGSAPVLSPSVGAVQGFFIAIGN